MARLLVRDLMTEDIFTVHPNKSLDKLYDLMMEKHIHHVPVVNEKQELVGLVSYRDVVQHILQAQSDLPEPTDQEFVQAIKIERIMVPAPMTATPDQDIREAGEMMLQNKVGCLPVVEGGQVIGILTEADFVKHVVQTAP